MKRVLSIALIFSNVVLLLSQNFIESSFELKETMYFKRGDNFTGELISIKLNQKLDPMTGFTSKVVFKPNDKFKVSPWLTGGVINDGQYYIFDVKDIDKIIIELKMKSRNSRRVHSWSKVIYSDEVQKDYSGREEINVIIENGMQELYQKDKIPVLELNKSSITGLGGFCMFVSVLFSALGA